MRAWRFLLVFIAVLPGCEGPAEGPSGLDLLACRDVEEADLDHFEIGAEGPSFAPWLDGDTASVDLGIQGLHMIVVREHVHGDHLPRCMRQRTTVELEQAMVGLYEGAVNTQAEGERVAVTEPIFAVISGRIPQPGEDGVVTREVGGQRVSRRRRIGRAPYDDVPGGQP